jgi:hypothetical protein
MDTNSRRECTWRIRYSEEINASLNGEDVVRFVRSQK